MKTKQGISLIVLVITIIIMIILAAAVMISLSNSNIINRANEAVDANNLSEVQHLATLIWAEAYLDGETMDVKDMKEKLADQGIKVENFDISVTENGVTVTAKGQGGTASNVPEEWKASVREVTEDNVPIPVGFVKSPYPNEGEKDTGLVIYALTPTEITNGVTDITTIDDDHQDSLETRNQFVWVPVDSDDFEDLFVRNNNGWKNSSGNDKYTLSPTLGTNYWELVLTANNMVSQNTTTDNIDDYVSSRTLQEATAMYESVKKYGGFYIARYEVGADGTEEDEYWGIISRGNLSVTMGKYPYNAVDWGASMENEVLEGGAVTLARSFYPSTGTTYGVVSTLTYGVQWDRTLNWWKELNPNIDLTNSTDYGVHYDTTISEEDLNEGAKYSYVDDTLMYDEYVEATGRDAETQHWLMTTGAYKKTNVYNIYDMAGNLAELTMEGCDTSSRVRRGTTFNSYGAGSSVAFRSDSAPGFAYSDNGFRPSLYIK